MKATELFFILDKSGSMAGLESDTIGGFNSMLKKQKEVPGECRITTVLFDNRHELLHDRIDIRAVSPMTEREYRVGGSTALLDAIGLTIQKLVSVQKNTAEEYRAENVMFVIITDGEENSSTYEDTEAREGYVMYKILIVEDDNVISEEIGRYLTKWGYDVKAVADFRETRVLPQAPLEAIRGDHKKRGKRK